MLNFRDFFVFCKVAIVPYKKNVEFKYFPFSGISLKNRKWNQKIDLKLRKM